MRKLVWIVGAMAILWMAGCDAATADRAAPAVVAPADGTPAAVAAAPAEGSPVANTAAEASAAVAVPAPIEAGKVTLTPENSRIEFVGIHLPPKQPDPRTGGFEKFTGQLTVDAAAKALQSIKMEIDTTSLWTQVGSKLTTHLKNPDFLEVDQYPTIKFESTKIEPGQGECQVTGRLTLHGETKEITFPAKVEIGEGGIVLRSQFEVDRAEFGMKRLLESVGNKVTLTVVVGEKTQVRQGGGPGGRKGKKATDTNSIPK